MIKLMGVGRQEPFDQLPGCGLVDLRPQAARAGSCAMDTFLIPVHVGPAGHASHSHWAVHQRMARLIAEVTTQVSRLGLGGLQLGTLHCFQECPV